ncbi:MAG: GNAT family N-acetyltransferase [Clostridiales bacterium]|nr:GNAT family N-acetyltransferase [Clostridiales bacterium]
MNVRLATEADLDRVNELRRMVNDVHVAGRPDIFKAGFAQELQDRIYEIWDDPEQDIAVAEKDGVICGFAILHHVTRPENPFMLERDYLDVDEFGVDEAYRRQGAATALIAFAREYAAQKGIRRIELNMWEFNEGALAFYEAAGFTTYRRYMEISV